jgi:hypothetical protein
MEQELNHYEFINSQTGNVIAYVSLSADIDPKELARKLEQKKTELAVTYRIYIELIYWQHHDHCIR